MTDAEIAAAANVSEAAIYAVRIVESGARPHPHAVRFEPRLFHHERSDLAARFPQTGPKGTSAETDRGAFERALLLDPHAAVVSSSFGTYQELGHVLLEITGLPAMDAVHAFDAAPDGLSGRMLLRWMKGRPAFLEAMRKDPPDFDAAAMLYNGKPSYAPLLRAAYYSFGAKP